MNRKQKAQNNEQQIQGKIQRQKEVLQRLKDKKTGEYHRQSTQKKQDSESILKVIIKAKVTAKSPGNEPTLNTVFNSQVLLQRYAAGERNFRNVNLRGENLKRASLSGIDLSGADLSGANLYGANLELAELASINLEGANLQEARLFKANLQQANISNANLKSSYLVAANLQKANLQKANLQRAILPRLKNMRGANLYSAKLQDIKMPSEENIYKFILPNGIITENQTTPPIKRSSNKAEVITEDRFTNQTSVKVSIQNAIGEDCAIEENQKISETIIHNTTVYELINQLPANAPITDETHEEATLDQSQEMLETINTTVSLEIDKLAPTTENIDVQEYFSPKKIKEAQERITISIARRQGQSKFRQSLLNAYNYRCAITGCEAQEALEAAHIIPYCETENNHPSNGLLLRADLHTLFDLDLIVIDPETMKIHLAPSLRRTNYGELEGKSLKLPKNKADFPKRDALQWRCNQCWWYS
ncbi:MAG: pentapeptide repeat-containing protein [Cyanobacteriota bacterium]